jgi:hypothetical protein
MTIKARILLVKLCLSIGAAFNTFGTRPFHSTIKSIEFGNAMNLNRLQKASPKLTRNEVARGKRYWTVVASAGPLPSVPTALERSNEWKGTTPMTACVLNLIKNIVQPPLAVVAFSFLN